MDMTTMTISDLEQKSGVSRRTIHFYTQQGVLPPPEGTGGGARYGEIHLLRLLLIQDLQKSHLKLAGIREALDQLSLDEMRLLVKERGGQVAAWDRQALEKWLTGAKPQMQTVIVEPQAPFSFLDLSRSHRKHSDQDKERPEGPRLLNSIRRSGGPVEEQWTRFSPADGIELNVRSDVLKKHRSEISAWLNELELRLRKEYKP
jgi:DNA-binding transcriptional MerR regulator